MESPGTILRRARNERTIDLDELSHITRISLTTLQNLERDSFDELPAEVFVRGFLRNVARELKIDSELVIQSYEEHTGRVHRSAMEAVPQPKPRELSRSPQFHLIQQLRSNAGAGLNRKSSTNAKPFWERAVDTIGSARPPMVIGSLVVLLGIALVISVMTTSSINVSSQSPAKASWNTNADGPKAQWILDSQSKQPKNNDTLTVTD